MITEKTRFIVVCNAGAAADHPTFWDGDENATAAWTEHIGKASHLTNEQADQVLKLLGAERWSHWHKVTVKRGY